MPVADTSWLYALMDSADRFHDEALGEARTARPVLIAPETFAEFMQLIAWRRQVRQDPTPRQTAIQAARTLLATPTLRVLPDADAGDSLDVMDAHPRLSYADACAVALARRHRESLLTFDSDQAAVM